MQLRAAFVVSATCALLLATLVGCGGGGGSKRSSSTAGVTSGTTAVNATPTITGLAPTTATVGVAYSYQPQVSDPDSTTFTFQLQGAPGGMTVDAASGLVSWTPAASDLGQHPIGLSVSDGQASSQQTWTLEVFPAAGGVGQPLPASFAITEIGAPPGGLPVTSDLVVFDDRLFMLQALDPLAQFGAQVWSYDDSGQFVQVINDPTSQGFLRGKVFGGKLYLPDADPNGLAPGIVYILDSAAAAPRPTVVLESVHNFDVVELGGELYTTGGLDTGASGLNRYDAASDTWVVASRGAFSRLKYVAVLDGELVSSKRSVGSQDDLVLMDPAAGLAQQGADLIQGQEAFAPAVEQINDMVYVTLASNGGISHVRLEPGGAITPLTGLSGTVMMDFVQHTDSNYYALGTDGTVSLIYGSADGVDWVRLAEAPDLRFGLVGQNADGRPSIASFKGKLFCGSSTNGRLYRLD
jgi:Putative Ig domain